MGSRGSIIPLFLERRNSNKLPITDVRMTRFMISLDEGVELVWKAFNDMKGGEIYVKKIKSMKVTDIALTINPSAEFKIIGCRPGEKLHEQMINAEDALSTYEYDDYFKIYPSINHLPNEESKKKGKLVKEGFIYESNLNKDWMTKDELRSWIENHKDEIGII